MNVEPAEPAEAIPVRKGVDPNYLQTVLTKDITPLESIYDLIDNAIDAARDLMLAGKRSQQDKYGLPADYTGYRLAIRFGRDGVFFLDNCSGIDEPTLTERAFVTGAPSSHRYGIGRFGIGLKRALLRLGTDYALSTDTGSFAAKLQFGEMDLGGAGSNSLSARRARTTRRAKTLICITKLRDGVQHEFGSETWLDTVVRSLARRYGLYIAKGLELSVNGTPVPQFGPGLRKKGPVPAGAETFATSEGVRVFIDAGMHEDYRLTQEKDYEIGRVGGLTDQYGWYFVCNDRIIKVATHDSELGWTSNWHQEYYGFVGWVRFVSEDVDDLPWDTKKSSIDPNSSVFRQVAGKLQPFAEAYKTENRKARKSRGSDGVGKGGGASGGKSDQNKRGGSGGAGKGGETADHKADHNENWTTLLPTLNVVLEHPKVRALVSEAVELPIVNCYSAAMLFRSIVETALFEHLKGSGKYKEIMEMVFQQQADAGREFTAKQKQGFRPTFRQALDWLNISDEYFPVETRRECITARTKFGKHLKELNGVVHESDLIDSGKLKIMRNDTLPLLRFLLGTVPEKDG